MFSVSHLAYAYPPVDGSTPVWVFDGLDLEISAPGRVTALMGASGCGKSTLAGLLYGSAHPLRGAIRWSESCRAPHDVVLMPQRAEDAIMPFLRVAENLHQPLRQLRWQTAAREARVEELLNAFGLVAHANAFPKHLSGGQLQRLGLARSLSWRPQYVIVDEGLSSLDMGTKRELYAVLREQFTAEGRGALLITHNLADVIALADRCLVLGERPSGLIGDVTITAPFPREPGTSEYLDAQEPVLSIIRQGVL